MISMFTSKICGLKIPSGNFYRRGYPQYFISPMDFWGDGSRRKDGYNFYVLNTAHQKVHFLKQPVEIEIKMGADYATKSMLLMPMLQKETGYLAAVIA